MDLVGYSLYGQDNDTYMFRSEDAGTRCEVCHYRLDQLAYNPEYISRKSKADLSSTYEGFWIVSAAFRKFCLEQGYEDLVFGEFLHDKKHYNFAVKRSVQFDSARRQTRFENLCARCGNYESVVGATPAYLLVDEPLEDGFYRSDLLFGSGDNKNPLILVGMETMTKLKKAALKGLEFSPAYGRPQPNSGRANF